MNSNIHNVQEMVLIMYNVLPEEASLEQILNATRALIKEEDVIPHTRKTIDWEDLL